MANNEEHPRQSPRHHSGRLTLIALGTAALLVAIFAVMVVQYRTELRAEVRKKLIGRDAAVLYPIAEQQVAEAGDTDPLGRVFKSANRQGMLGVAVFDDEGRTIQAVPSSMLFVELPADDYLRLLSGAPLSRYHPDFALDRYFAGVAPLRKTAPVLEVLLPLHGNDPTQPIGFVRYYIDAQPLSFELAAIDQRINRQTTATLAIGSSLIAAVLCLAYLALRRADRAIAERNAQLIRANFELSLAAKASALGQITSHLIHGLQGSVAGLRAMVVNHDTSPPTDDDWRSAASYTERMQNLIQETVGLLSDVEARATYELSGSELVEAVAKRCSDVARARGVSLSVESRLSRTIDSHQGSLICLIAANLAENAIAATPSGRSVSVVLGSDEGRLTLTVDDQGPGISGEVRRRLFEPGATTKKGGTGLGLAISRLLARQLGGELTLLRSDDAGTRFLLWVPAETSPTGIPAARS